MHFVLAAASFSSRTVASVRKNGFVEGRRLELSPTH